jgi:hypothetical protein
MMTNPQLSSCLVWRVTRLSHFKTCHWAHKCHVPKKEGTTAAPNTSQTSRQTAQQSMGKPAKSEMKPVGSANIVDTKEVEGDSFWAVEEVICMCDSRSNLDNLLDLARHTLPHIALTVITLIEEEDVHIELYDSGATCHISPYKEDFISYTPLNLPLLLNTANKQQFPALGRGTMVIQVPNGDSTLTLTLHDILHALSVGYTLVSLGTLDHDGYCIMLGSGCLDVFTPGGVRVANIPKLMRRLYCIVHLPESANAVEIVSVMELHRRLGHIMPTSAHRLVDTAAISGIAIDPAS